MKFQKLLYCLAAVFISGGIVLLTRWLESPLFHLVSHNIGRAPSESTANLLQVLGEIFLFAGLALCLAAWQVVPRLPVWGRAIADANRRMENRIDRVAGKYISFKTTQTPNQIKPLINRWDILVSVVFLMLAIFFFLVRVQKNYPEVFLGSDAANIASFAAAWDHPDLFTGDGLLNDHDNIRIYSTVHIPLLRFLRPLVGSYGLAMSLLLIPTIFIQLLGFYIFGLAIFQERIWGFLLALLTEIPVAINLGEAWGIPTDPVPRFLFQALLPFILTAVWVWRDHPRRWPWIMAATGALVYFHPVSTPVWIVAIWLSLWLFVPKDWTAGKRWRFMAGLGLIAVLVALPYAAVYLGSHKQGQSASYSLVYYVLTRYFPENLLNMGEALKVFGGILARNFLPLTCIIGLAVVWILRREDRSPMALLLVWATGIALMAIVVPWIEQTIERYLRMIPIETELVRGIRYFIPLLLIGSLWPFAEIYRRAKDLRLKIAALVFGIAFVAAWGIVHPPYPNLMRAALRCFSTGRLVCPAPSDLSATSKVIAELTPPGSTIFSNCSMDSETSYGLFVRYQSMRGLTFSSKDRGLLGYSNEIALRSWVNTMGQMEILALEMDPNKKFEGYLRLSEKTHAQYLLVDLPLDPKTFERSKLEVVYHNPTYTLVKLPESAAVR